MSTSVAGKHKSRGFKWAVHVNFFLSIFVLLHSLLMKKKQDNAVVDDEGPKHLTQLNEECWGYVSQFLEQEDFLKFRLVSHDFHSSFVAWSRFHVIRLRTGITDEQLVHFIGVKKINLSFCSKITDKGLAHLKDVIYINLRGCSLITDAGLAHLAEVEEIGLTDCLLITDAGLAHLKDVKNINLTGCSKITDVGLAHLKDVISIILSGCKKITDAGLVHLEGVNKIVLYGCKNITDKGLTNLKGVIIIR